MSSLQRRVHGASGASSSGALNNNKKASFENCFSNGLDISEFTPASSRQTPSSAASDLLKLKALEHREEVELDKRIADVRATNANQTSPTYELSLRAENPHYCARIGSERDNNFLQFENGSNRTDNGFISALVQSHNTERKSYCRTQRSSSKSKTAVNSSSMKYSRGKHNLRAKKAKKSKY